MVGKQTILTYQEQSQSSDGQGGCSGKWSGIRRISGNLMLDMDRDSYKNISRQDRTLTMKNYTFVPRLPIGITITESGRFLKEDDGRLFDIKLVDPNSGEVGIHTEIWLQQRV